MAATGIANKSGDAIAMWPAPDQGVVRNVPRNEIPPDALYDASNVMWREGSLQARPGLTALDGTNLVTRPTGAYQFTSPTTSLLVVGTNTKIWSYASSFTDITDTPLTATSTQLSRFTSLQVGSSQFIVQSNGVDAPRSWNGVAATVSVCAGTPPLFTDLATVANRVIGLVPPFTVQWGQQDVINSWPAANFRTLSDTPDPVVAIRNLGTLGCVVYKKRSIWLGIPTGGTDAGAFRFEFRGFYEGPASAQAVVDADGLHVFITKTGRVGVFDGTQVQWIGERVFPAIRSTVDTTNMGLAFGVYEPTFREVYFAYPRTSDSNQVKGLLSVALTSDPPGIYPGSFTNEVSTGTDTRLTTNTAVMFTGQSLFLGYTLTGVDDAGTAISGYWHEPMQLTPKAGLYHASGLLTLAERAADYGGIQAAIGTSNVFSSAGGTLTSKVDIDLSLEPEHPNVVPKDARGRYMSVRYDFTTPVTLRYVGAMLYGARLE